MISLSIDRKRLVIILAVITVLAIVFFFVFSGNGDEKSAPRTATTTTTTLPPKDAQACEYLTEEALEAGGIVPDVNPQRSNDLKRCTYEDIGNTVNYITLYVDMRERCKVWLDDAEEKTSIKEVSPQAVFVEELDPTIIVPLGDRCFFLQASKTIMNKNSLTKIAAYIADLFIAIDETTTTTTPTTVVLPEDTNVIPGVNRATTVPEDEETDN